jgi:UDP-N-acetylmuramoyl-L-alanyl-D-glutamate--2,6-diaminopimelate ligase
MSEKIFAYNLLRNILGKELQIPSADFEVSLITADSRQVKPNSIFVAIPGTKVDGADFAAEAVQKGAKLVIAGKNIENLPVILVDNPSDTLAKLSWSFYGIDRRLTANALSLYAVTGTNGKTTFCYLFQFLAKSFGKRCARFGTIDYDLITEKIEASHTTPDTAQLARIIRQACDNGADSIVMEASSHALDQGRVAGLSFKTAVFSNLTGDHLDYHGSMQDYREAKLKLFHSLASDSFAVINADDPSANYFIEAAQCRHITYGIDTEQCDLRAEKMTLSYAGTSGVISWKNQTVEFHTPLIGKHNVYNLLAAVAAGLSCGFDLRKILDVMRNPPQVPGRLERVETDGRFGIFVDYAHTDDGLDNVLSAVKPLVKNKLILVFGCGGDRDKTKRPRMAKVAEKYADQVIVTSDNPRTENPDHIIADILVGFSCYYRPEVQVQPDRTKAIHQAIDQADQGDIILIAGKGHETYQIVGTTKIPFDDRKICAEFLIKKTN